MIWTANNHFTTTDYWLLFLLLNLHCRLWLLFYWLLSLLDDSILWYSFNPFHLFDIIIQMLNPVSVISFMSFFVWHCIFMHFKNRMVFRDEYKSVHHYNIIKQMDKMWWNIIIDSIFILHNVLSVFFRTVWNIVVKLSRIDPFYHNQ